MHHTRPLLAGEDASSLVTTPAATPRSATATTSGSTTTSRGATATGTTGTASTSRLLDLGRTGVGLRLGQELLEGEELVAANVDLVARLEAGGVDAVAGLDGEVDLVQRAEDLVDLADLRLVLEEDRGVEVGNLGVDGFADHLALGSVHEGAHLCKVGSLVDLSLSLSYFSRSFNARIAIFAGAYQGQSQEDRKTGIHRVHHRVLHHRGHL